MDVNAIFASAEQAFLAGRLEIAREGAQAALRAAGEHPAVLHLLALVEKKSGDVEAARGYFVRAIRQAPGNGEIANNFANLLAGIGETEEALRLYDRAIAAGRGSRATRFNRALALEKLSRHEEALDALDALTDPAAPSGALETARGSILRKLGRIDQAADAYDRALAVEPTRPAALHGRARVALERAEDGAVALYLRALELQPQSRDLVLGLAEAHEVAGDSSLGIALLRKSLGRDPGWIEGHETLARMRSEAGEGARALDHYVPAIAMRPDDPVLAQSWLNLLAEAGEVSAALKALRDCRSRLPDSLAIDILEASMLGSLGRIREARCVLAGLPAEAQELPASLLVRARVALRASEADEAAALLQRAVELVPEDVVTWAYLEIAWRVIGHSRHEWLVGRPGFHRVIELDPELLDFGSLAGTLRKFHQGKSHPLGQSLRGGTQTRGRLLRRTEPQLRNLRQALEDAVEDYFAELPSEDPAHPLLRYRHAQVRLAGSWSVRLSEGGFHFDHVHPNGIVSSAFYVSLPEAVTGGDPQAGWLELGRPPRDLGLALEPLAAIEPRPGRLVLFPSYLFHGTRPFPRGERLTVAFDVETAQ